MKNEKKDEWLTTMCFKLAADKDAPVGVRILGPVIGLGMIVVEPIARFCFWIDERNNSNE